MHTISDLEAALLQSWSRQTSSDPDRWHTDNPAWGQCAVTALVLNDYFGGRIVWANVALPGETISHYFNIVDGNEMDLTRRQFPPGTIIPAGVPKRKGFPSTRAYVLSYEQTQARYAALKEEVDTVLIS